MIAEMKPRPNLRRPTFVRELLETIVLIGLVYTLVNLATVRFYIEGPSMPPNFWAGQFLIVSRVTYMLSDPQRGDIVVFDPGSVTDRSTYAEGRRLAEGVEHVLVNGTLVLENGEPTGATPGRALRRG